MLLALAREDRSLAERAAAVFRQVKTNRAFAEAYTMACLRDDPAPLLTVLPSAANLRASETYTDLTIAFLSECGVTLPLTQLDLLESRPFARHRHCLRHVLRISRALAAGDDARLAAAIEDAEAHGLIPHAARMRVVLAQRTGDRTQLERARPVLEGLDDRQFLRRLAEAAASLE